MKHNTLKGKVYDKLIRRLFLQTLAVLGIASASVILLREAVRGKIADIVINVIASLRKVDWNDAYNFYSLYVRKNIEAIMLIAVVIFFFLFFRVLLSWFTKYFDQIVAGVDRLAQESDEDIVMLPELEFMASKLNEVKSKLKQRSEEAHEAERKKNDLVMYLAHDIKTPLTSVIGYLSLLDEAPHMPEEQKANYVHIALEKANRLEKLISEFFEITQYNFGTDILSKEYIDLYYMLTQMADEFYPLLNANAKQVNLQVPEDITIYGDPDKLARVFNNILKNAVAYSPTESVISIKAATSDNTVFIAFSNEGDIPKDKLTSIFDKFYRLDEARSTDTGGAGLGLAIAKGIVLSHNGNIHADSDGKQITFTIELPLEPGRA